MSLPKMTTAVDNISKLDTRPNAVNGLTADELKAKFDKAPEDIKRFLNEVLIPALDGAITLDALGAVPETRKVNGKPLDADVTLGAADIDYAGTISGAANVKEALEALNAKKDVAVFSATLSGETLSSAATFPEISAAYSAGKQVLLKVDTSGGIYWLLPLVRFLGGMVASFAAWVSNSRLAVATLSYNAASTPPVNAWSLTQVPLSAESVAYSATIDGTAVQDVDAALDALAAREAVLIVNAQQSISNTITADKTYAEISAAGEGGKEVICVLTVAQIGSKAIFRLDHLGSKATFRQTYVSGNQTQTITLKVNSSDVWTMETEKETPAGIGAVPKSRTVNGKALSADIALASQDIGYSGTIGETTAENVKAALDALAVGKPLDMTADYVASGATSVEQWATMAAAQTATEGAALPTPEYRVAAGRYRIVDKDNSEEHDVTIMDVPADPQRIVLISRITVDPFWYFDVCSVAEPGSNPAWLLSLSTEESLLSLTDGCVKLLPGYNKSADSNDADKILMLKSKTIAGNTNVYPSWGSLPIPQATADALGGIKADAKTADDVLPVHIDTDGKLWAPQIVDAKEEFSASNMDTFMDWAYKTNDTKSEYLVKPGMYRVNEEDTRPTIGVIVDGVGSAKRWAMAMSLGVDIDSTEIRFTSKDTPGGTEELLIVCDLSAKALCIGGPDNLLLPEYTKADKGKVLKYDGFTTMWASIDPVDATADVIASGVAESGIYVYALAQWALMPKTGDASKFRVATGKYFAKTDYQLFHVDIKENDGSGFVRRVEIRGFDDDDFDYYAVYFSSSPTNDPGEAEWFLDSDAVGLYNRGRKITLPTTSAADAGKIVTVGADGNYALTELPKYDGGVS